MRANTVSPAMHTNTKHKTQRRQRAGVAARPGAMCMAGNMCRPIARGAAAVLHAKERLSELAPTPPSSADPHTLCELPALGVAEAQGLTPKRACAADGPVHTTRDLPPPPTHTRKAATAAPQRRHRHSPRPPSLALHPAPASGCCMYTLPHDPAAPSCQVLA